MEATLATGNLEIILAPVPRTIQDPLRAKMARNQKIHDYSYVELFAGCGGMSLGLENAGFMRLMANELSPMAAETFAYNLVEGARDGKQPTPGDLVSWRRYFSFLEPPQKKAPNGKIDGQTFRNSLSSKPRNALIPQEVRDTLTSGADPNLLVGDANRLADVIERIASPRSRTLWQGFNHLDVLAGGPPCQSFSLAGKRQKDNPRNSLFNSFVKIARELRPRVILFENVLGITKPFRDKNGGDEHPWFNVCCAFRSAGFVPVPSLINAADFGVPQSRLRFILIGLREDLAEGLLAMDGTDGPLKEAIALGKASYGRTSQGSHIDESKLIFRTETDSDRKRWPEPLFPTLPRTSKRTSVTEAIGDLLKYRSSEDFQPGPYARMLARELKRPEWIPKPQHIENHKLRNHGDRTRARFRLMRVLATDGELRAKSMADVMRNYDRAVEILSGKKLYLLTQDGEFSKALSRASSSDVADLLGQLASAKHAQRCLDPSMPAPAQLSIPDDLIHWKADRVLSVREMARIQSFPDWFVFRSKETTGGSARAYEVPQYTQVGNAVPPLLAKRLGEAIIDLLARYDESRKL